jgi:hypothetical protein
MYVSQTPPPIPKRKKNKHTSKSATEECGNDVPYISVREWIVLGQCVHALSSPR